MGDFGNERVARRTPSKHLGHENASKTRTHSTTMRQKRIPLSRKSTSKARGRRGEDQDCGSGKGIPIHVQNQRLPSGRKSYPKRGCLFGCGKIQKWSSARIVLILIRKRTDSETFPAHPTGEHMLAGRLAGWAGGWLGAWLVGWLASWLIAKGTKMRQKRAPLPRKCVKNAYP